MNELSDTMQKVLDVLKQHKELVRYHGGFWSWKGVEIKRTTFTRMRNYDYPIWYCDIRTLHALQRRGLVELDEKNNICRIIN